MLVAIGSTNPMKMATTADAFRKAFGERVLIRAVKVPGLNPQPIGLRTTLDGAVRRAGHALTRTSAWA